MRQLWREWNPLWGMRWNSLYSGVHLFVQHPSVTEAWGVLDGAVHVFNWKEDSRFGRVAAKVCDKYDERLWDEVKQ